MDPEQEKKAQEQAAALAQFQEVFDAQAAAQQQGNEELAARHLATMQIATPAQLAEVLNAPGNRAGMIAAAHKKFGNAFVDEAVRLADAKAQSDQDASVALTQKYWLRPRRYAGL